MRVTLGAILVCIAACAPDFDATRTPDSNSLGARMVTLLCKRLAFQAEPTDVRGDHFRDACAGGDIPADAPPTLVALLTQRPALIKAIDTSAPDAFTGDLQAFLTSDSTLALYDNDTMSRSIASLADLLDEVSRDDAALATLARVATRDGYRPAAVAFGLPAALALARSSASGASGTPSLHAVLVNTIPAITAGGAAHAQWDALVAALSATLLDYSPPSDAGSPERTLALARDFLLTERPDLTEPAPLPLVLRDDRRGIAHVALVDGKVPPPFVDTDGDLLADVDALDRFVDAQGAPLVPTPPAPFAIAGDTATRDAQGRVSTYDYLDLSRTVIGAVGHDVSRLFDPAGGPSGSPAFDAMRGASALLGPRVMAIRDLNGAPFPYLGYDTTQSPLLDMLYGWSQLLRDPDIGDILDLGETLLADHSAASARFLEAAITTARFGDAHPEAQILPGAPMWDELMPIVRQILAQPALVKALFDAFEQPQVKDLGMRFHDLLTYSDRFDIDPTTQRVTGSFTQKPDRTRPDSGFNRSLFQRFLHVIHDSNGVQMCNKEGARVSFAGANFGPFAACTLIQIDDLATFYLDAIAFAKDASGNTMCEATNGGDMPCPAPGQPFPPGVRPRPGATLVFKDPTLATTVERSGDQALEVSSTITGFRRHPTPAALNRVLFLNPTPTFLATAIDPAVDGSGALFRDHHPGTLPVLELNNFYGAIRPIIQAFVDNHAEQLFINLMSVMHKYWPSKDSTDTQTTDPEGANYAFGGDARSWEPLLADGAAGDLLPALVDNAAELNAIMVNGKPFATVLTAAANFAINPLPGLTDRQGRTTTTTADGQLVTELTPWHVLADAYLGRRARIDATGAEGKAWESGVSGVVDVLFRASNDGSGWAFRNPRIRPVSHWVIEFLRRRIAVHNQNPGDLTTWLTRTLPDNASDTLTHPVLAAAADLGAQLTAQGAPRTALEALLHDAFDETASPALFGMLRTGSGDLIQLALDDGDIVPVAHLVGRLMAPDKPYLATQLNLLQNLAAGDQGAVLARLAGQVFTGYDPGDPGVPAIAAIANGIGEVDRRRPAIDLGADWTKDDFVSVLGNIAAFLRDQQRGFPRFISIIKGRNP